MRGIINVHDLPEDLAKLIQDYVETLRRELKTQHLTREEKEKDWAKLAITSFAYDLDNEKDAIYNTWRERYHVSEG